MEEQMREPTGGGMPPYEKIPSETAPHRRPTAVENMAELCGVIGSLLLYLQGCPRGRDNAGYLLTVARLCGELRSMALLEKELEALEEPESGQTIGNNTISVV